MTPNTEPKPISKESLISSQLFPYLQELTKDITQDGLAEAFLSPRHPNPDNPQEKIYLPKTEAALALLDYNQANITDFLSRARDFGLLGTADGIKVNPVDTSDPTTGPHYADAYVTSLLEILLQTASHQDLFSEVELIPLNYSGDENIFILAPTQKLIDQLDGNPTDIRNYLESKFEETRKKTTQEYYQNNPFFAPIKKIIKQATNDQEDPGMHISYSAAQNAKLYKPTLYEPEKDPSSLLQTGKLVTRDTKYHHHLKSILGGILDIDKQATHQIPANCSVNLLDELQAVLLKQADAWYNTSDHNRPNQDSVIKSSQEASIFPDSLGVKTISQLEKDLANKDNDSYLIRFADIRLKHTNKDSHVKGDFQLIATVRLFQRFLRSRDLDPHENIEYYQHNGSFLLSTDQAGYSTLQEILDSDPNALNDFIYQVESQRTVLDQQDPFFRAHPYIVVTTEIYDPDTDQLVPAVAKSGQNIQEVFDELISPLKEEQLINETNTALDLLNQITAHPIVNTLAQFSPAQNLDFISSIQKTYEKIHFYAQIAKEYLKMRPGNTEKTRIALAKRSLQANT